jgi:hypothetical protein
MTLTPMMFWNVRASSASQFAEPAKVVMPALLTRPSSRCQRATAAAAMARQASSSATSPCISSVSAPASRQAASVCMASCPLLA